jgi:hypothetical protein
MTNQSKSRKFASSDLPFRRLRKGALAGALIASLGLPVTASAATVKSGASCPKVGRMAKVGKTTYKCAKSRGKLKWVVTKNTASPPDTKAPDTKAPDTKAPDTKAPDTKAP